MDAVTRENFKRSTSGRTEILVCAISNSKNVAILESCGIAWVAYLGQISIIESGRTRKNYKRSAPGRAGILACAISYSKNIAVSESLEIARLAY